MQRQHADDEIETLIGEGQGLFVDRDRCGRKPPARTQDSANGSSAAKLPSREFRSSARAKRRLIALSLWVIAVTASWLRKMSPPMRSARARRAR